MSYNQQWPGHGKEDMAQSLAKLVEITPQLPIAKIVNFIKRNIKQLVVWLISKKKRTVTLPTITPQQAMRVEKS